MKAKKNSDRVTQRCFGDWLVELPPYIVAAAAADDVAAAAGDISAVVELFLFNFFFFFFMSLISVDGYIILLYVFSCRVVCTTMC